MKLSTELEERISMYEYNVKKAAEDRGEFKATFAAEQVKFSKELSACKVEIESLKNQLSDATKSFEIEAVKRTSL